MIKRTLIKRMIKQFSAPFILAVLWTTVNYNLAEETKSWHEYVNIFGPSFFFFTWFIEQYFRVFIEDLEESSFSSIANNLEKITKRVEDSNNKLLSFLSKEKTYYKAVLVANIEDSRIQIGIEKNGEEMLDDVEVSFYGDITELRSQRFLLKKGVEITDIKLKPFVVTKSESMILIIYNSRENTWVQHLRVNKKNTAIDVHSDIEIDGKRIKDSYNLNVLVKR